MRRLIALLSAAALVLVSLASATAADSSARLPVDLTASTPPSTLVKGDVLEIAATTCSPAPGQPVSLERRVAPDGAWFAVRTTSLDSTGSVRFTVKPNSLKSFDFRVRLGGSAPQVSDPARVRVVEASSTNKPLGTVRASLPVTARVVVSTMPQTLAKGDSFAFAAAACPMDAGAPVAVERRVAPGGSWATIRTATLDSRGTQQFTVKPNSLKSFDFRVRVAGSTDAVSSEQRVTVVESVAPSTPPPSTTTQQVSISGAPATLVTGDTFDLTVTTKPAAAGIPVTVQKSVENGDWFDVRQTRLDSAGSQTFTLKPIAKRSYGFRAIVSTDPAVTSRAVTVTVVGADGSGGKTPTDTSVPRYQLFDDRSDQYVERGRWVTLHTYDTRSGVPSTNIVQLNMNIRAATGDRPTHLVMGWWVSDTGERVGEQTMAMPGRGGDRPFQVSHDYTFLPNGSNVSPQIFIPGSGQVKITTEVVKAIAHPAG